MPVGNGSLWCWRSASGQYYENCIGNDIMTYRWGGLIFAAGILTACVSDLALDAVYLKHSQTGKEVKCGPFPIEVGFLASDKERQRCVNFFKDLGYVRIPAPK